MRKYLLVFGILTSTAAGLCGPMGNVARAADLGNRGSIKDTSAPVVPRWSGFYIGGQVGHGQGFYDGLFDSAEESGEFISFAKDLDLSGLVGGVHVGYNLQRGNLVFGVEGDFNWTGWKDKVADARDDLITGNIDWLATVRGRVGIATDRTLVYATAGIAFADAEYTAVNSDGTAGTINFDNVGFVVGGGAEYALTERFSLRLQGLYYVFGDRRDGSTLTSDSDAGDFAKLQDAYTLTAGVSLKF